MNINDVPRCCLCRKGPFVEPLTNFEREFQEIDMPGKTWAHRQCFRDLLILRRKEKQRSIYNR